MKVCVTLSNLVIVKNKMWSFCFSDRFEWDSVDTILDLARGNFQCFAVITVASAEIKIFKGCLLFL
jgi:hypothetical protein